MKDPKLLERIQSDIKLDQYRAIEKEFKIMQIFSSFLDGDAVELNYVFSDIILELEEKRNILNIYPNKSLDKIVVWENDLGDWEKGSLFPDRTQFKLEVLGTEYVVNLFYAPPSEQSSARKPKKET